MNISQRLATKVAAYLVLVAGVAQAQTPYPAQSPYGYEPQMMMGQASYTPHGVPYDAQAQMQYPAQAQNGYGPQMMGQVAYGQGPQMMAQASYTPHGIPFYEQPVVPATFVENGLRYYDSDEPYGGVAGGECSNCGENCGGKCGGGLLGGGLLGGGGSGCSSHWFDFHAEFMYLTRDDVTRYVPFTSNGKGGSIILSSDDIDFNNDPEAGIRLTASFVATAGYDVEVSYFGTIDTFRDSAQIFLTDSLFSAFSDFGTDPDDGFAETDDADTHSIDYSSRIHSGEVNLRRRWANPKFRVQGSSIWGFRYFRLEESLLHNTIDGGNSANYALDTTNDMYGLQFGGDLYFCLVPGVLVGGEAEVGGFYNHIQNKSNITLTSITDPIVEEVKAEDISLVAEASVIAIVQLTRRARLRCAFQVLYLEGVGLAMENFDPNRNFTAPNTPAPFTAAAPFVNDNGSVFYHGINGGFEWVW